MMDKLYKSRLLQTAYLIPNRVGVVLDDLCLLLRPLMKQRDLRIRGTSYQQQKSLLLSDNNHIISCKLFLSEPTSKVDLPAISAMS